MLKDMSIKMSTKSGSLEPQYKEISNGSRLFALSLPQNTHAKTQGIR